MSSRKSTFQAEERIGVKTLSGEKPGAQHGGSSVSEGVHRLGDVRGHRLTQGAFCRPLVDLCGSEGDGNSLKVTSSIMMGSPSGHQTALNMFPGTFILSPYNTTVRSSISSLRQGHANSECLKNCPKPQSVV